MYAFVLSTACMSRLGKPRLARDSSWGPKHRMFALQGNPGFDLFKQFDGLHPGTASLYVDASAC